MGFNLDEDADDDDGPSAKSQYCLEIGNCWILLVSHGGDNDDDDEEEDDTEDEDEDEDDEEESEWNDDDEVLWYAAPLQQGRGYAWTRQMIILIKSYLDHLYFADFDDLDFDDSDQGDEYGYNSQN